MKTKTKQPAKRATKRVTKPKPAPSPLAKLADGEFSSVSEAVRLLERALARDVENWSVHDSPGHDDEPATIYVSCCFGLERIPCEPGKPIPRRLLAALRNRVIEMDRLMDAPLLEKGGAT